MNVSLAGSVVNITDAEQVGTITTSTGTTVNMSGGSSLLINNGGTNNGTMNLNASSLANATLTNNGLMTFTNGFNIHTTLMNGTTGTIDLLDDTGLTDNGALINSGTLELNGGSGTAKLNGIQLQDLGGTINVQSGTLSDDQNAVINNATFTIASGAAFAFDPISPSNGGDTFYFSGTSTGTGAGHLIFNSGGVTPGNPDATVTSSILNFPSGFAQVTGTNFLVNPQDGAVQLVTNTGFLNYTGSATHADLGMFNYGTIEVTGTGNIGVSASGPFTNEATGVIDFAVDASFVELGGNTGFTNFGTIEKTGGVGTSSIAFNGIDSGATVNAQTGTIDYPSGFSFNNTTFIAAAGATISLDDTAGGNNFGVSGTLRTANTSLLRNLRPGH